MTPTQREVAKRIGLAVDEQPGRSAEEWRAAADESFRKCADAVSIARIAVSFAEADKLLIEARHQLHIAGGQLRRAFGMESE